jgi:hypothetical protein
MVTAVVKYPVTSRCDMAKTIPVDANPLREASEQARKQLSLLVSRFEKGAKVSAKPVRLGAKKK